MNETKQRVAELWDQTGGNVSEISRLIGVSRSTVNHHMRTLGLDKDSKPLSGGKAKADKAVQANKPKRGAVKRYLLTSLQNNTVINDTVWSNLMALKAHYKAEVHVARFTYNKNSYGRLSVKPGTASAPDSDLWYDPSCESYFSDDDVELAPGLVWCGRQNTLPTAQNPLGGFESYHGRKSTIIPHVRIDLKSIPSGKFESPKLMFSTGTVGKLNYIQKRMGIKAEHHHSYGALLVEVNDKGQWWCRQLHADGKGRLFDLDVIADGGKVRSGKRAHVESITWGDIHLEDIDPVMRKLAWSTGGILDTLKPNSQVLGDLVDPPRSYHNMKDPHLMFEQYVTGRESMGDMCDRIVNFVNEESFRRWCTTIVANSNHDNMVDKWLREADYRLDPVNALFFLEAQLAKYEAIAAGDKRFLTVENAMRIRGCREEIRWLREDESVIICKDRKGGIEIGAHGHLGPNGARGSAANLSKMSRRMNRGHSHTADITAGVYTAGTSSKLDLGYNRGPSSWSHSFVVTYTNGKRQIITVYDGKWRA